VTTLLHFSDPHLEDGVGEASLGAFFNKRALGFANLVVSRRGHFKAARATVDALARFADARSVDFALCTGDYTALGTEAEILAARRAVAPIFERPLGFATVPGNHDLYVDDAPLCFETAFADGLESDDPRFRWSSTAPYVRYVGEHIAIVGIASARPNAVHRSSGEVPQGHLDAIRALSKDPSLGGRFVIVALHYAPRLWNGRPDSRLHGLDNHEALLDAARGFRYGAIVFGHVHHRYTVSIPGLAIPLVGAGSATYVGRQGAWLWSVDESSASATPLECRDGSWVESGEPKLTIVRT